MSRPLHAERTYVETARNRQFEQLIGVVRRKAENEILPRLPFDVDAYYDRQVDEPIPQNTDPIETNTDALRRSIGVQHRSDCRQRIRSVEDGEVTFLNQTYDFTGELWNRDPLREEPLLWWLKLQGFEHLRWLVEAETGPEDVSDGVLEAYQRWIESWIRNSKIGNECGFLRRDWIPHAVSLRILNFSRFLAWGYKAFTPAFQTKLRQQVYRNALFLMDHVETDVGGNHLVENAVALLTASVLTEEPAFRERGLQLFRRASRVQFLPDGGHFERSPMYHILMTTRFLTARHLLEMDGREPPDSLRETAENATRYLKRLRPPDHRIPLLHDSVFGETLSLTDCLAYARETGVSVEESSREQSLPASGYYWLGSGESRLLASGGPLAVPNVPAHAHVHPGHVSLWLDGQRVFCDTGTYSYEPGDRRQFARGIEGHNTVRVDGQNPVSIAGSFLMGDPIVPETTVDRGEPTVLSTEYRSRCGPRYRHRRRVFHAEGWWLVDDSVEQQRDDPVSARYHLHPDCHVVPESDSDGAVATIRCGDDSLGTVHDFGVESVETETTAYFPEYGSAIERETLDLRLGTGATGGSLLVTTVADPVGINSVESDKTRVTVGDHSWDLPGHAVSVGDN